MNAPATQVEVLDGIAFVTADAGLESYSVQTGELLQVLPLGGATLTGLAREGRSLYTLDANHMLRVIDVARQTMQTRGALSLANNGGFASVRSVGRHFDLSGATAVVLRVLGDGRRYQLRLATDARHRGIAVSFGAGFDTIAGQWIEVRVPLDGLQASVRGSLLEGQTMDPARVREIGLLVADKREGAFALSVDWIALD